MFRVSSLPRRAMRQSVGHLVRVSIAVLALSSPLACETRAESAPRVPLSQTPVGNAAAAQQTLQVAEATVRTATSKLLAGAFRETDFRANASGLYFYRASNYTTTALVPWKTTAGWNTALKVSTAFSADDTTTDRRYIIEELPPVRSPGGNTQKTYRITARVIGVGGQGSVMLQTLYKI